MHEVPRLSCVFGCDGVVHPPDSLTHYMECPFLWTLVYHTTGTRHHMDLLTRLGMLQASMEHVSALFCAFHVNHALKVGNRGVVLTAFESSEYLISREVARSSSRAALAFVRPGR